MLLSSRHNGNPHPTSPPPQKNPTTPVLALHSPNKFDPPAPLKLIFLFLSPLLPHLRVFCCWKYFVKLVKKRFPTSTKGSKEQLCKPPACRKVTVTPLTSRLIAA